MNKLLKECMIDINIPDHLPDHDASLTIYLIDFMVLVQSAQKGESKTFGDLPKVIAESVTSSFKPRPNEYNISYNIIQL